MSVRPVQRIQDRILSSLGRSPSERRGLVHSMLDPPPGESTGYWLQLAIATLLATLGLALDSTAVVIGAMLIAPLMRPLVHMAMGLATGSAGLTLAAIVRTVASLVLVVVMAVVITSLLPFHPNTSELDARTAPSLLDLALAGGCALAAAYATVRADAEIATTAAGTSVGISLVPPLCACGYSLAIGDAVAARGAALLFTANLSGILAITTVVFLLAGFTDTKLADPHEDDARRPRAAVRVGRAFARLAGKRLGPVTRFFPPLLLLGLVVVPLGNALDEIKRRTEIQQEIARALDGGRDQIVEYRLQQSSRGVTLRVIAVGDADSARQLDVRLRARLRELGVTTPDVTVWAVPEASSLSALAQRLDDLPPPYVPPPRANVAHAYTADLMRAVRDAWPPSGTGQLVDVSIDAARPDRLRLVHLGPSLGEAGLHLLERAVEQTADHVEIEEEVLPVLEADADAGAAWIPQAFALLDQLRRFPSVRACITAPRPPVIAPRRRSSPDVITPVRDQLATRVPAGTIEDGTRWSIAPAIGDCPSR